MKNSIKCILLGFLLLLVGSLSYAQVTTSSLGGQVVDQNGEPVIGAAIIATHTASGSSYGAVTNNDGRYTIQGMRAGGPYKVEISGIGYQTTIFTDIKLNLGELYSLNAKIKEASEALSESVVVASPASKFVAEKTGASTNISSSQLQSIPTVSRSITDIAKLSPYGGNGMSFAGADGRSTNFTVDGANFNNNFGLSSSLPGGGSPISLDAIEEMQVVVSPFDVRQTNFIGGGVNAITKSGTNTFKASAYMYHRNENMRGNRINGRELTARSPESTSTLGFTAGGPIIKNKLFFFVNYERVNTEKLVNRWRASKDGVANKDTYTSRATISDLQKVSDYLQKEYGYDAGSFTDYNMRDANVKMLARIDWNINMNHHLAIRYNYTADRDWNNVNGTSVMGKRKQQSRTSDYAMTFSNSLYAKDSNVSSFSLDLNSRFSNNISNQLLLTYTDIKDKRYSPSKPFPFVDILKDGENYMAFGYELFTWNNAVNNNIFTIKDDLTYYTDAHKITAGLSYEYQRADNSFMTGGTGYYRYNSLDDFINKKAPETVGLTYGFGGNDKPAASVAYSNIGLYVQDEWNINRNFKLTAGLRFDTILFRNKDLQRNKAIYDIDYNGTHIDTGKWPNTSLQFSPRLGFVWDVLGDKSLKIRGGTGLFAGRLPLVFMTNMPTNAGFLQNYAANSTPEFTSNFEGKFIKDAKSLLDEFNKIDPKRYPKEFDKDKGVVPYELNGIDPNFKMPQIWKSSLAVDYQLPTSFPMSLSAEFILNKNVNAAFMQNLKYSSENNEKWNKLKNGGDNRHVYPKELVKDRKRPNAYVLTNTSKGYGYTANITLNAEPVKSLNVMASYTYTVSKELTGMPGNRASSVFTNLPSIEGPSFAILQNSQYVNPHRLIASISYSDKSNNHFSLFYQGIVYRGSVYMYDGDINGDGNYADLMYIPKSVDEIKFATEDDKKRYQEYAKNDQYLNSHRGQYAEAYSAYAPMVHTFDFRYAHDFKFKVRKSSNILRLSLDFLNVGNFINSSWGVRYSPANNGAKSDAYGAYRILKVKEVKDNVPVFTTNVKSTNVWDKLYSPGQAWYVQFGIKYMFN